MKLLFRRTIGYSITLPFYLMITLFSVFVGREKAILFWGPIVVKYIQYLAEMTVVPKIKCHSEFDRFIKKMNTRLWVMKPLYDIFIAHQDEDKIVLHYKNCPHCETFIKLGLPEIAKMACDSDWNIAEKNSHLWGFERNVQLSSGHSHCDHTYIRKQNAS